MAKRDVNILIQARDEATATMEAVAGKVRGLKREADSGLAANVRSASQHIEAMNKLVQVVAAVETGSRAVTGVVNAARAGVAAWRGDFEKVADLSEEIKRSLGSIPGAGQGLSLGGLIGELIFRDKADAEIIRKRSEEMEKQQALRVAEFTQRAKLREFTEDQWRQVQLLRLEGVEREKLAAQLKAQADLLRAESMVKGMHGPELAAARAAVGAQLAARIDELTRKQNEQVAEESRIAAERAQRVAEREVAAAKALAQNRADVHREIRLAILEATGRDDEARLQRVRDTYDRQIEIARDAGQAEIAERLEVLKQLKLLGVEQGGGTAAQLPAVARGGEFSRMLTGVSDLAARRDSREEQMRRLAERTAKSTEGVERGIQEILRGASGGVSLTPAGFQ